MTGTLPATSDLPEATIEGIISIFKKHPKIEQAILYGSRAKGSHRPGSDIDLTLQGELSHEDLLAIETQLDDLMLLYKVDLSLYSQIDNESLVEHIRRAGKVLSAR